jgi:hypothetical protein
MPPSARAITRETLMSTARVGFSFPDRERLREDGRMRVEASFRRSLSAQKRRGIPPGLGTHTARKGAKQ